MEPVVQSVPKARPGLARRRGSRRTCGGCFNKLCVHVSHGVLFLRGRGRGVLFLRGPSGVLFLRSQGALPLRIVPGCFSPVFLLLLLAGCFSSARRVLFLCAFSSSCSRDTFHRFLKAGCFSSALASANSTAGCFSTALPGAFPRPLL